MSSRFEEILKDNSEHTSLPWQEFAHRGDPIYSSAQDGWGALAYGYKVVADIVAKDQIDHSQHRDVLFSPIFFLYRHYFELELKYLWQNLFELGQIASAPPRNTHRVLQLWLPVKKVAIKHRLLTGNDAFVKKVEESIKSIDSIDGNSQYSRYSTVSNEYHSIYIEIEQLVRAADDFETLTYALYEWQESARGLTRYRSAVA